MNDRRISGGGQIRVYLGKCFRLFRNEKQWKYFVSTLIIMLIISMVTSVDMFRKFGPTKNGSFAIICACIWVGLFNSIQSICRERDIIKREHRTGLRISSYVLAHMIYEAFLCAVEAAIITAVTVLKNVTHLPAGGLVLGGLPDLFITFFLTVFAADMIAILVSSLVRSENSAMTVMPFVLIIQLVMSGSVFELTGVSKVISYFTISKWGLDGVCSIANTTNRVFTEYRYLRNVTGCDPNAGNLLRIWLILLVFAAVYVGLSILALRRVDKDQR